MEAKLVWPWIMSMQESIWEPCLTTVSSIMEKVQARNKYINKPFFPAPVKFYFTEVQMRGCCRMVPFALYFIPV